MVDSRNKGYRAETQAKDLLVKHTKLKWKRVPGSGALHESHGLKGDLYIPDAKNWFCIEVKHYKDDQFTSKILSGKSPTFLDWLDQSIRQGKQVDKTACLMWKFDRSKWFMAIPVEYCDNIDDYRNLVFYHDGINFCIALATDILEKENIKWVN